MQKSNLKILPIEITKKLDLDKNVLYHLYIEEKKPSPEVAKILNVSPATIRKYLKEYNIPLRTKNEAAKLSHLFQKKIIEKEKLYRLYVEEKKSLSEIAKMFRVCIATVLNRMKEFGIERRADSEALKNRFKNEKASFYGKHHSEEAKIKISEAGKGRKSAMYGKHHSEETKRKISEALKSENAPGWKGGITPENDRIRASLEMKLWKKAVLERDNFTCQACSKRGGKLHVHHINNFADFPELRVAIDNGITLCKKCHKEFHHLYGNKNNTKGQLEEFTNFVKYGVRKEKD